MTYMEGFEGEKRHHHGDEIGYQDFASEDWPLITQFEDPEKANP